MKTSNYRKHFAFLYLLLLSVIFYGCDDKNVTIEETTIIINGRQMKIHTIDSCEYVGRITGGSADVLTHKGNCKFCTERNKK